MNIGDIVVVKANCPRYQRRCNSQIGRVENIDPNWNASVAVSFENIINESSTHGLFYFPEGDLMVTKPVWKAEKNPDPHEFIREIKNVYFNDPVTVVMWNDGTKTIVRCSENDFYDPEKGLAMAIVKKVYGNDNSFHKIFKKWLPDEDDAEPEDFKETIEGILSILLGKD